MKNLGIVGAVCRKTSLCLRDHYMRYSKPISGVSYGTGNGVIFSKDFLFLKYDEAQHIAGIGFKAADNFAEPASGIVYFCSSVAFATSHWFPKVGMPVAGGLCLTGGALMTSSACHFDPFFLKSVSSEAVNWFKLSGGVANIMIGTAFAFKNQLDAFSLKDLKISATARFKDARHAFMKAAQYGASLPFRASAVIDAAATVSIFIGAQVQPDVGMAIAMSLWGFGVGALWVSEEKIQKKYQESRHVRFLNTVNDRVRARRTSHRMSPAGPR